MGFQFLGLVHASSDCNETRELLAYEILIIHLARKHEGLGWVAYNSQFRQQAAAGACVCWPKLNLSLMAATVVGARGESPAQSCSLHFTADQLAQDCA